MRHLEIVIPPREGQSAYYNLGNPKIIEANDLMRQVLLEYLQEQINLAEAAQKERLVS